MNRPAGTAAAGSEPADGVGSFTGGLERSGGVGPPAGVGSLSGVETDAGVVGPPRGDASPSGVGPNASVEWSAGIGPSAGAAAALGHDAAVDSAAGIASSNPARLAGALLLALVAGFAVAGPWLVAAHPAAQDLAQVLQPPSAAQPLGTDHLGRSMLSRLAHAARLSLGLAALSVLSAAIPGTLIGLLAAWRGGWAERLLAALADAVLALPGVLLVLLIAAFSPGGFWPLYVGLSLAIWVEYFRVVRASVRAVLASPHVEASRLLGFGPGYIVRHHLWPELAPAVVTLMTFGLAGAVLSLSVLGFAGVGIRPPTPELGLMMIELLPYYDEAPWLIAAPVGVLALTVLGLALLAHRRGVA